MRLETSQNWIAGLLVAAWLAPLAAFTIQVLAGRRLGKMAAYLATGAIGLAFLLSAAATFLWLTPPAQRAEAAAAATALSEAAHQPAEHAAKEDHALGLPWFSGTLYEFAQFGQGKLSISYYVDGLTLVMFLMVGLVATLIHVYSIGYMHEELEEVADHEVHGPDGQPLHRPGRFPRFFTYLSLFCFSMLGLVLAGNIFQVFIFWELVGLCSYLLIGFYFERKSASNAANKAFIVNRVGDFGFLVGLMILWSYLGTLQFSEMFTQLRGPYDAEARHWGGMTYDAAGHGVVLHDARTGAALADPAGGPAKLLPYAVLVAAGLGIFCGCVGKSAQFPLHTWLPDAMEGPTPVSALIHAATMVAAGVYLVGRFYPVFTPEALLVIAYIGGITLFLAATIAIVATDIKRVLAYSTISQLGYMMLALGVGGWVAGLFHLLTHAFFKALLFLGSGSVIHATHTNEMPRMGGLRAKMPITFGTMLVGVLAICGTPLFSGYYSKDEVIAYARAFGDANAKHYLLYLLPTIGAGITAFYMFRMLFLTFFGRPRDHHVHDHAHESPGVMWWPLVVLALFSLGIGWGGWLPTMLHAGQPFGHPDGSIGGGSLRFESPTDDQHEAAGGIALAAAVAGALLAYLFYGAGILRADEAQRQFAPIHRFLVAKWYFDDLYDLLFVRPAHRIAAWFRDFDRRVIDGAVDGSAAVTLWFSRWDGRFDLRIVDGLVNLVANGVYAFAAWVRGVQTGQIRQYVLFIVVATIGFFVLMSYVASG